MIGNKHWVKVIALLMLAGMMAGCGSLSGGRSHTTAPFAGDYSGRALDSGYEYGDLLVENLEVSEINGIYRLKGTMNATNEEPGMDHVSNTYSHWTGVGKVQGDTLVFSYSDTDDPQAKSSKGTLRVKGKHFILVIDGTACQVDRVMQEQ